MRLLGRFGVNKTPNDIECALRRVVTSARRNVPYYRDLLETAPSKIVLDGLWRLPITTKADLVAQSDPSRISRALRVAGGRHVIGTSGTTGQVLFIHMSRSEALFRSVTFYRSLQEHIRMSWPLTLAELGVGPYLVAERPSLLQRTSLVRLERIPRLLPTEEQARRLLHSGAQVITGQATCLDAVARHLVLSGRRVQAGLVVSRGEVLAPSGRQLLEKAFDARVVDYYNCEEIGNVAYECPANSSRMHVNTDCCILEIVDHAGKPVTPGIEGRIVVTNLFNLTMPFIRYDLGDLGTLTSTGGDRCECESRRPTMLSPAGRSDDFFRLADGTRLAPRIVEAYVVPPILELLTRREPTIIGSPQYQIIQESERFLRVLIAGELGLQQELKHHIEASFRAAGHDLSVAVEEVASIPPAESGKSRRIISQLKPSQTS